ncbi:MAG: MoxR family ATPase [archaeon]
MQQDSLKDKIKHCSEILSRIRKEISQAVVGQDKIVEGLLRALLADGHVLIEGVPGIAKTLLVRALGEVTGCEFKRIQFTVDLLPTDILGITTYTREQGFTIVKGPIFANYILADEINRSPPKTQSALLEAMQEKQVTIGKETFPLPLPFFVMATQNPIETAGVYTLPEAQVDRFLFKLLMGYPSIQDEEKIVRNNMTLKKFEEFELKAKTSPKEIVEMQRVTKKVFMSKAIEQYIVKIVNMTRNPKGLNLGKYIEWGASPRASIGLFIAAKAEALMHNNSFVVPQHVKNVAYDVLRHRILLNYEGQAENIKTEDIITEILSKVPVP